jgi:hypothetical protein
MIILAGCPAQTRNSIDNGSYAVPSWIQGTWQRTENGSWKSGYKLEKDSKTGYLKRTTVDSTGKVTDNKPYPVVMSDVGGKIFLSVFMPEDSEAPAGYYLYEFRKVSNKEFTITPVKEKAIDFDASQATIKNFLLENKDNSSIFDASDTWRYVKQ